MDKQSRIDAINEALEKLESGDIGETVKIEDEAQAALLRLRERRPLVHCITNYVTAGDTANMLLAVGASPIMADDPREAAEVTRAADALYLNLGTLSESRAAAMLAAGKAAGEKGIPIVLDLVGVHLTDFRAEITRRMLSELKISVLRGNAAEVAYVGGVSLTSTGLDSSCEPDIIAVGPASRLYRCVAAASGAVDKITDGSHGYNVYNGCEELRRVSGTGCMAGALMAAFCAVTEPLLGAALGAAFMGVCGEKAIKRSCGAGSFRMGLFDAAGMDARTFSKSVKIESEVIVWD